MRQKNAQNVFRVHIGVLRGLKFFVRFRTRPANVGTRNPRGLIRPAQDSSAYSFT